MTSPFDVIALGETMLSLVATDGPLASARVAAASTTPSGSTEAGSVRNAAQRAWSAAVLHSCAAGPTAPKSVGGSGRAWSEYSSTR